MENCKIAVDVNGKTEPTNFAWQFGIGNDHAFQLLRKDVLSHLKLAHDELGIKYVRFHGIFDDDMQIIQRLSDVKGVGALPNANLIQEENFRLVAQVYDNILEIGMKPFVELSFMPSALASGNTVGFKYQNNITMPKNLDEWAGFIKRFITFLIERYGREEVESWYFEVWNEPDLAIFLSSENPKQDYFALYKATVCAIKEVDCALRVGGPSTSACLWVKDFVGYCKENSVPYDFVSTHHYPGDAFGNIVSENTVAEVVGLVKNASENKLDLGDTVTKIFYKPNTYKQWKKGVFALMDEKAKAEAGDAPLFISEWNSMAVYGAPIHDEKYSASFVIKSVLDVKNVEGYMFWCCSDIFEEVFDLSKPFHGSFGIITNDGIPKPNFWAFKILSRLYPERLTLQTTDGKVEYAVFKDNGKIQVLVYAQDFDTDRHEEFNINVSINGEFKQVFAEFINDEYCNPKGEWIKLQKPNNFTREQVASVKQSTSLKKVNMPFLFNDGNTEINFKLFT
ncbi:MAG: hypothetical protein IKZ28_01180, partial [Clostridia bacterium]|nr:hypothetical protein [Clostridia bacterium]